MGCSFNLPKDSAKAVALEARTSVARLLEEVPAPDGRTPRRIAEDLGLEEGRPATG